MEYARQMAAYKYPEDPMGKFKVGDRVKCRIGQVYNSGIRIAGGTRGSVVTISPGFGWYCYSVDWDGHPKSNGGCVHPESALESAADDQTATTANDWCERAKCKCLIENKESCAGCWSLSNPGIGPSPVSLDPADNSGRSSCFWCGGDTKKVRLVYSETEVCPKCKK